MDELTDAVESETRSETEILADKYDQDLDCMYDDMCVDDDSLDE